MKEIENTKFGQNKYYKEIIENFIKSYYNDETRIDVLEHEIKVKANDEAGSRNIYFKIKKNMLEVKIDRMVNNYRYQDIIVYDEAGIMMKRSNCVALLRDTANKFQEEKPEVLSEEFKELGKKNSVYTSSIFKNYNYREVERPSNYGLNGSYVHKNVSYDERGLMHGELIEGEFRVLESSSISSLDFPNEENINITKKEDLSDQEVYEYPNYRKL